MRKRARKRDNYVKSIGQTAPGADGDPGKRFALGGYARRFVTRSVHESIPARFEKIVRMYPNRLALQMGNHRLTYEELNRYANRISRAILEQRGREVNQSRYCSSMASMRLRQFLLC